jgi:hypothetical protein
MACQSFEHELRHEEIELDRSGVRTEFLANLPIPAQEEIRQRFQRHSFAFEALE